MKKLKTKINSKNFNSEFDKLVDNIKIQINGIVGLGSSKAFNKMMKKNVPVVTGTSKRQMQSKVNNLSIRDNFKSRVITRMKRGEGLILAQEVYKSHNYARARFGYPKYVTFVESAHLEKWLDEIFSKGLIDEKSYNLFKKKRAVFVGGERSKIGTNMWFNRSETDTKKNLQTYLNRQFRHFKI